MIVCIVPAAGESSRFPWFKLLYKYEEKPLIKQTIDNILNSGAVDLVVVVTGYGREKIRAILEEYSGEKVIEAYNPSYRLGMSFSVKTGIRRALETMVEPPEALMINPADASWIHPGIYSYLVVRHRDSRSLITIAGYQGRPGHPIIISSRLIEELLSIDEETAGLKAVVKRHFYDTQIVETMYPGVVLDLDQLSDLIRIKNELKK